MDADLVGRCALEDIVDPTTGEVIVAAGDYVESLDQLQRMYDAGMRKVKLRALLTCRSKYGVCQKCYGWDLSTRRPVNIGTAVGIIAAQSIGEPGTQLTMRTIHSGGLLALTILRRVFDRCPHVRRVGNVNEKILGREAFGTIRTFCALRPSRPNISFTT